MIRLIRLIRTELLKLRTMRVSYGLLLIAVAVTALFASLQSSGAGRKVVSPISTAAGLSSVTTVTGFAMVIAAVLGVIMTSGEFRHSSATLTYLATPGRGRVVAAKAVVAAGAGAIFGFAAGVVSTGVGLLFVATNGDHVTLGTATLVGHVAGAALGSALLAVLGVGVGSLVRSQLGGVIGIFIWCIVIESVIGENISSIRPYLPYTAASTLGGAKLGAAAFGPGYAESAQAPLAFVAAAVLVAAIVGAISLLAIRTSVRHDVT
jgi:ABC-type transport system involved in multi-copper enzyme maturation permease subunit